MGCKVSDIFIHLADSIRLPLSLYVVFVEYLSTDRQLISKGASPIQHMQPCLYR